MSQSAKAKLGLATATIVGMNAMIGAGIFSVPSALAGRVGPAGILTYLFVIASVWCMAQLLSEVAKMFPKEGSFYAYTKSWGGHKLGLMSVLSYNLGVVVGIGLLVQIAGNYLHSYIPIASPAVLGITLISILTILNAVGVKLSKLGQHVLIICTVFPILTIIFMGFKHANLSYLTPFAPYGLSNVMDATSAVIFGFFGFEAAASLFNVVRNPERTVPKALTYSISIVGGLYLLFAAAIILSTPKSLFTGSSAPLTEILRNVFPNNKIILTIVHFAILSAITGTLHSMVWSTGHLLQTSMEKVKANQIKRLVAKKIINNSVCVLLVGSVTIICSLLFKNLDLFFGLTAILILFPMTTAIIPLLRTRVKKSLSLWIKIVVGLATTAIMYFFAFKGIVEALIK